ncbi:phosphotransferase [Galbitalea sp. SE-J8]|uniref:phosphotransferase n=1 Tax=Galbitalea sp. SE-J8 TaxID=3054952 RepID=UPI00259D22B9|nr:phosphotransferase [Galbitalea sp. SE-J8]MDM4761637.1 phosphotransferase [Galbitalea sp. SE-J8]
MTDAPGLADALGAPFAAMTEADAAGVLRNRYGIRSPALRRLESERDDTFRVESPDGEFVLKVAHPDDDPLEVNLQTAAMAWAGDVDPALPVQRVLPSVDGEIEPTLVGAGGRVRVTRVLSWLPGRMLSEVEPTAGHLRALGAANGRLSAALEGFGHPADERAHAWDLARLPELAALVELAPDLAGAFDAFVAAAPGFAELPRQVVHNDLNHHNVVVDPGAADFVVGILDFGDAVRTWRVADLAITASYLVDPAVGWASIEPVVEGYRRHVALTDAELAALPALVRGRLVQRILLGTSAALRTGTPLPIAGLERSRTQLASLG